MMGWRAAGWMLAGACAFLAGVSCQSGPVGPGYLPEQLEGTLVGEIVELGEGLTSLGARPEVLDVLVERRPVPGPAACASRFYSVRPDTDVSIWRRADELRAGSRADLEVGAVVRVRHEGPCFASCPGLCAAIDVDVFVR